MSALAPIAPEYTAPMAVTLLFQEMNKKRKGGSAGCIKGHNASSSSSSSFGSVRDSSGRLLFTVEKKKPTLSRRRRLIDGNGKLVGQIRRQRTGGIRHPACYIGVKGDEKRCRVRAKGLITGGLTRCDASIYMGDKIVGEISGRWGDGMFEVQLHGTAVGTVSRSCVGGTTGVFADISDGERTLSIRVQAGVDVAFVVLIALAMADLYREGHERDRGSSSGEEFGSTSEES